MTRVRNISSMVDPNHYTDNCCPVIPLLACPVGSFGAGCEQNCTCVPEQESSPCDNVDGTCSCLPGYTGPSCDQGKDGVARVAAVNLHWVSIMRPVNQKKDISLRSFTCFHQTCSLITSSVPVRNIMTSLQRTLNHSCFACLFFAHLFAFFPCRVP